jgi:hypothetical protein
MKRSQKHDRLRRHIGRVLGRHDRWGTPPLKTQRLRAYRTATSPTIVHLMEDDDTFEAYVKRIEDGLILRGRPAPR